MSPYLKKLKQSLQIEIIPTIQQKTSKYNSLLEHITSHEKGSPQELQLQKYSNQVEPISGESVTTRTVTTNTLENQEDKSKDKIHINVFIKDNSIRSTKHLNPCQNESQVPLCTDSS